MLNFVIIDDNVKTLSTLSNLLENLFLKHDLEAKVIFQTSNVEDFLNYVLKNKVDVLFLDIELRSNLTGLELAEKVRKTNKNCYIIFTTAHPEYGLIAYKFKTFDFIQKPISYSRVEDCILRLFDDVTSDYKKFIRIDNKNTVIAENEVEYIKRDGMKIIFHTNYRDYEIYSSFTKLQDNLSDNFVRCHKSFIANINNVTKVEPVKNIIYFNSSSCDIGPKYKTNFLEVINNYGNIK